MDGSWVYGAAFEIRRELVRKQSEWGYGFHRFILELVNEFVWMIRLLSWLGVGESWMKEEEEEEGIGEEKLLVIG